MLKNSASGPRASAGKNDKAFTIMITAMVTAPNVIESMRSVPAEGVHIWSADSDANTRAFYVIQKIPTATATVTDASGQGGFINLRAGSASISGTLSDGTKIGTVTILVRAGTITYTNMLPSPN